MDILEAQVELRKVLGDLKWHGESSGNSLVEMKSLRALSLLAHIEMITESNGNNEET